MIQRIPIWNHARPAAQIFIACASLLVSTALLSADDAQLKQHAAFYTPEHLARIRANAGNQAWATKLKNDVVEAVAPWMTLSDEELWGLMFGATIPRSWMVWSNGHCPACQKPVPMYTWKMEPWKTPWKTRCPHCAELFPKNDFQAFYLSGQDEHGVFDPKRADRKLLFNTEHPDANDPLHRFGVDDGEGYVEDGNRWRFIGAYLIYGEFRQRIMAGIKKLSAAWVLTGDQRYAHKAGILLDRVADLYPTFDFAKQGYVYETPNHNGYVSTWHDACEETYDLVLAYDQLFEGLRENVALLKFLSAQSAKYKLANPKRSFTDLRRNIEGGILRDPLANMAKIHSNFPRRECTVTMIHTVLGWPENKAQVEPMMDAFIKQATAVDGVTGEKGLAGYSAYTISALARFLGEYVRTDREFLKNLLQRNPRLRETYRFFIDTHCLDGRYYPLSGDTGGFAQPMTNYAVTPMYAFHPAAETPLIPSLPSFLWKLYQETGDIAYVQTLHRGNESAMGSLPFDLFTADTKSIQRQVARVIAEHGPNPKLDSIDKQQWHLAILRSGQDGNGRAAWLDYDSGGAHGHHDGMNLGLFAHGLDLLPDFGYPPVQFGGWQTPRANWYLMSAAHNTVVVDGANHVRGAGKTTLWANGKSFRAIRASGSGLIGGQQFERTINVVDVSEENFYLIDLFRVMGGGDHAKFIHGHFGRIKTGGLLFKETTEFGHGTQTRAFQRDPAPAADWSVTWNVDDQLNLLPPGKQISMRYTDLSGNAEAWIGEAWVARARLPNSTMMVAGYSRDLTSATRRCVLRRSVTFALTAGVAKRGVSLKGRGDTPTFVAGGHARLVAGGTRYTGFSTSR